VNVKKALIIDSANPSGEEATPGYFFQPGKNSLSLKQLAGLPETPWRGWPNP
jgi:hypothetical protein